MLKHKVRHVHFVGIGGSGMCGIAEVLLTLGYRVSGSDLKGTEVTERLKDLGARVAAGHAPANVGEAQVVVYSSAVNRDNPELVEARRRGIPLIRRAEMLAELMRLKYGVAVAGSHGKTTTTSMTGAVLAEAGLDPTVVIGGRINSLGSHARAGAGDYLVAEADESDASFLCLTPVIAVITNIDEEHMDHYRSVERLQAAFVEFTHKVPFYGTVIACADDAGVRQAIPSFQRRLLTYGFSAAAALRAEEPILGPDRSSCRVAYEGRRLGDLHLSVPGRHNVSNALAALAAGMELDVSFEAAAKALAGYSGVGRRLQFKGEAAGVRVYDDYGHHPTEVRATLAAARLLADGGAGGATRSGGKLWVLFEPHRYTRTNLLHERFGGAFAEADGVVLADIYPAGEQPIPGVSVKLILEAVRSHGHPQVELGGSLADCGEKVAALAGAGDVVLTLGAGDVGRCGEEILAVLARRGRA